MSMRTRFHIVMGEFWGNHSGRALSRCARHAARINDIVTLRRIEIIVEAGINAGWDTGDPTHRLAPNRPDPVGVAGRGMRY